MSPGPRTAVVLGSRGLLGRALCECLESAGWRVVPAGRTDLDLFDPDRVSAFLDENSPDMLFNAVAFTQVDKAEEEPEAAALLNEKLPLLIGRLARKNGILMVHFSTDFVFDGQKRTPYLPDDPVGPLNVYGKTKLAGERALMELGPEGVCIIRTAWLFGPGKTNFVAKILDAAKGRDSLEVVHDQVGSPTYTTDLAAHSLELVNAGGRGVFHLVNSGSANWCELASEAIQAAGLPCTVHPVPSSAFPRKALRPSYSVLDTQACTSLTGSKPRSWLTALREYVFQFHVSSLPAKGGD